MPILILLVCLCVFPVWTLAASGDENPAAAPSNNGPDTISLEPKLQLLAAIKTQTLAAAQRQPEIISYGSVINLEPLLQLRQQYLASQTLQASAQAKSTESSLNLTRTEQLHHQDIISTRRLQEQFAQSQADQANLNASSNQQQTILAGSRLLWGEILTEWFVLGHNKNASAFFNQDAQLIQISLPANMQLSTNPETIYVDERGQRQSAVLARLVSVAPGVDPVSLGKRYFFKLEGHHIPYGAHITAWLSAPDKAVSGIFIPKSALIWHLGQAWVFIKTSANNFSRRAIPEYQTDSQGYFVRDVLKPGEEVVINGSQTLLSHQLKTIIPNEDSD